MDSSHPGEMSPQCMSDLTTVGDFPTCKQFLLSLTSSSFAPHLLLLGGFKQNLLLLLGQLRPA